MRMGDRPAPIWRVFMQSAYLIGIRIHRGDVAADPGGIGGPPSSLPERRDDGLARTTRAVKMFAFLRRKVARKTAYTWKPALDLTDPRVAAILLAFGRA